MPAEDLPQPRQRLHGAVQIDLQWGRVAPVERVSDVQVLENRAFADRRRLGEQRVLRAVGSIIGGQTQRGGGSERIGAPAVEIAQLHEDCEGLVGERLPAEAEQRLHHVVGGLPAGRRAGQPDVEFGESAAGKEGLPDLHAARDVRPSIRVQAQPGGEQQHVGVGAENGPCGAGAGDAPADRQVESLQPLGFAEVVLNGTVGPRKRVEVAGHPPVVLRDESPEERSAPSRRNAHQIGPDRLGARPSGHYRRAVADLEHPSEEIQDMRERLELVERIRLAQGLGRLPVQCRKTEVGAAQNRIAQEAVNEFSALPGIGRSPVVGAVKDRKIGCGVRILEPAIGAQGLFELCDGKPGIDGHEGAAGVHGFEHDVPAATPAHAIAEYAQQLARVGRIAGLDADDVVRAGHAGQLPRLREIAHN